MLLRFLYVVSEAEGGAEREGLGTRDLDTDRVSMFPPYKYRKTSQEYSFLQITLYMNIQNTTNLKRLCSSSQINDAAKHR